MGRKLIKRHTAGEHEARVHRDSEYNAYRVTFYHKGKKAKGRTEPHYETDDEDDAHGTAQAELKKLHGTNESMKRLFNLLVEADTKKTARWIKSSEKKGQTPNIRQGAKYFGAFKSRYDRMKLPSSVRLKNKELKSMRRGHKPKAVERRMDLKRRDAGRQEVKYGVDLAFGKVSSKKHGITGYPKDMPMKYQKHLESDAWKKQKAILQRGKIDPSRN